MNIWRAKAALAIVAALPAASFANEPNDTFATATALTPGLLTVSDSLTPGFTFNEPDTLLGSRGIFGGIEFVDDDNSALGNGQASGLYGVPVNPFGGIDFAVTGRPNFDFNGFHDESGPYAAFVDVFDSLGLVIEHIEERRELAIDGVDEFSFVDSSGDGVTYDVIIDNVIPQGGDVDFFRFSGLTPGASFTAKTLAAPASNIDTYLGWFDASGALMEADDDSAGDLLSLIDGVVPAGGALTFAVSGFGDADFIGSHFENEEYTLQLTLGGGFAADFDNSGGVRGADLTIWRSKFGPNVDGDADNDNDTDGADLLIWQRELGLGVGSPAAAIPEPASSGLFGFALLGCGFALRRR